LRESVAAPILVDFGVRLLKAMGWFGVAMVEFKVDPRDGVPKLMEVNPKFWGSIALPIAAGVDFPYLLYRMALDGDVAPVSAYKIGVHCRWLLPGDILNFIFNPDRFRLTPSFFQFHADNLYYDLLDWDDLAPFWGIFVTGIISLTKPAFWRNHLSPRR
jgi:predicted ATP-grasp superfamily ATP-dependent carboligase